jgi:ABC-type molybdate transport system substrate-binding protein
MSPPDGALSTRTPNGRKEPEVAKAFLRFISSPEAASLIRKSAMKP